MSEQVEQVAIKQVEAAKRYGVSPRTISRLEKAKRIAGQRVGGQKMYPVKRLNEIFGVQEK